MQRLFTDEQMDVWGVRARQSLSASASLAAAAPNNPSQARSDARLGRQTGVPPRAFDEATRPLAEIRVRQNEVGAAVATAPGLASILANPERYERISDDLAPIAQTWELAFAIARSSLADAIRRGASAAPSQARGVGPFRAMNYLLPAIGRGLAGGSIEMTGRTVQGIPRMGQTHGRFMQDVSLISLIHPFTALGAPILYGLGRSTEEVAGTGAPVARGLGGGIARYGESFIVPTSDPVLSRVQNAARSAGGSAVILLAAAATRNPLVGISIAGVAESERAYEEGIRSGLSEEDARRYGDINGLIEAGLEALPVSRFVGDITSGSGFLRTLRNQIITEIPTELATTAGQELNRFAAIEAPRGATLRDYFAELPEELLETAITTVLATGMTTSIIQPVARGFDSRMERIRAAIDARNLDRLMEASAQSVTRTESPEDFQEIVEQATEGTGAENLYIPAQAVRSLFQSPEDLSEDDFWGAYSDEISEAEALNGDVVVPLAEAATRLAGTPQWEQLKDQVRTSPGGMSQAEAAEAEEAFGTAIREAGEALEAEMTAEQERLAPSVKVFEAMRDKLLKAGFRADAANQIATMFAQRQAVRAQRLGRELTGTEADALDINSVLPENLGRVIRAAEVPDAGLSAVISEMRRKRGVRSDRTRFGSSLIEFLAARGGIEDIGGDLTHMGVGLLKKGWAKKGQRKLIRVRSENAPTDAEGRPMLESPEHSFERALEAAIEAGYFPELTALNLAEADTVSTVDTGPLLEAIRDELLGRPRYARDDTNEADNLRLAAQELYALLDQQGLDPDKATSQQIARAVSQYQSAQMEGRSLDQLFVDPAQPERTMTAQQRAELEARQQQSMARRGGQESLKDQAGGLFSAERDQDSLFQTFGDGARGRITFTTDGRSVIDLFKSRDLSTAIHELGHHYLEELKADAQLALEINTQEGRQLFADWETVRAWFKREGHEIGEDGIIPTEAHELFARGFERYAMEGKAPSSALRRAFEAFRSWLLTIYKTVSKLRAPITPEIRDVMTRMLATDEEIAAAAEEQVIRLGFGNAESAGMTEQEYRAYANLAEEARDEAHSELLRKTMASVRAQRTKEYRTQEAEVRAEIATEVDAQPVFAALRLLRNGDGEGNTLKLDKQFLLDSYGQDALDAMPRSVPPIYTDKDATHPDVIAELAGFESGDEMIRTLMDHEQSRQEIRAQGDKRGPRQVLIDEETARRMAERYGDPLRDGSIEEEARALIHNDKQGEVLAAELRAMGRQTGQRPTPYAVARKWAAEKTMAGKVVDVASGAALQQYQRSARKAGKAFEEALAKGDKEEAFRQKQAQMLNNALIAEGKKAKDRVDTAVRRLSRLARRRTMKSVDQDYLDQVHGLLEQVDLGTRSQEAIDKQITFEAWARAQQEAGHDLVTPPEFATLLGKRHWSRISVEEMIGLDDTVQQIIHLGRNAQTYLDGMERRRREDVLAELEGVGGGLRQVPPSALNDPDRSYIQKSKSWLRGADGAMLKIEQLALWLDGNEQNGPFTRLVWRPIAEAQGREADLMREYVEKVNEALSSIPKKQLRDWNREVATLELINRIPGHPEEGQPWRLYKDQIVMLAMNWGNEGNRQRIVDGYGWSEAQVQGVLDRLMTEEDWAFVQSTWDIVDTLWPELSEMERRVNGFAPEKVEAIPVETRFGTFRGGYFPAVYDPQWSSAAGQAEDKVSSLLEGGYTRATVRSSASKERARQVKRPILLNMSVITRHLGEVIHDITHREALTEAWRLVSEPRFERVVSNAMGPEYTKLFRPWLKHVANDAARNANSNSTVTNLFRALNRNVTLVGLGYRLSSTVAQIAGMPNIIAKIGAKRMSEGWLRFMANPVSAYREVTSKSAEMRDRFSTMDRDIVERAQQLAGKRGIRAIQGPGWFTKYAYHGILIMDALLTTSGWIGAYRKATADGMSEEEAVHFADQTIRLSQGAGGAKDQAAVTREHEAVKVFMRFFSYFSALYSQQRDVGHRLRRVTNAKDAGTVLHRAFWVIVMPPIIDGLIREWTGGGGPGDDDEDERISFEERAEWLGGRVIFGNLASIPGIRDIAGAYDRAFGFRVAPVSQVGEESLNALKNLERLVDQDEETEPSSRWVRQTFALGGLLFGKPTGQIGAAAQFGYDTATGEAEPETAGDYYEGLTRGRIEAE